MTLCDHPRTVIDHDADDVVEECVECGDVIRVIEEDEEPIVCGFYDEETMDHPCQRRVRNEGDNCWQHDS